MTEKKVCISCGKIMDEKIMECSRCFTSLFRPLSLDAVLDEAKKPEENLEKETEEPEDITQEDLITIIEKVEEPEKTDEIKPTMFSGKTRYTRKPNGKKKKMDMDNTKTIERK